MKNYIEIEHFYLDEDGDKNWDVYHAVRPTASRYVFGGESTSEIWGDYWTIQPGERLQVSTVHDVAALRKLLDAIEAELKEES